MPPSCRVITVVDTILNRDLIVNLILTNIRNIVVQCNKRAEEGAGDYWSSVGCSETALALVSITRGKSVQKESVMSIDNKKDAVWQKAKPVRGKDPARVRQDPYGNEMLYSSYGKNSPKGWEIDHIKPKSRGGSDATVNLQALNTRVNREKGDSLKKRSRHSQR